VSTRVRTLALALAVAVVILGAIVLVRGRSDDEGTRPSPALPKSNVALTLTHVATVDAPTAITPRPNDTSLYVTEQTGRIRRLRRTGTTFAVDPQPFFDLSAEVTAGGEQGLLGLAFAADGQHLYVAYTNRDQNQQLEELTLDGDTVVGRRTLLVIPDFAPNHNGGDVVLGPDGFLYYTMGDGGGSGDPRASGQDPHDLLGDVLRIDPTKATKDKPYGIPADNPFADGRNGAPEVFHYGLRNPWRMSFDRRTHDLWIADVGQNKFEEIDFLAAGTPGGQNFGWSVLEGNHGFHGDHAPAGAIAPVYEYNHSHGRCSVTGGYVYRGANIPALAGTYLFGDECEGEINGLTRDANGAVRAVDLGMRLPGLSTFGEDNDGELYAAGVVDGSISRIDLAGGPPVTTATSTTTTSPAPAALSPDPATAADQLGAAEVTLRDPNASAAQLDAAAHVQQLAYRRLGRQPDLYDMVVAHAPPQVRDAVAHNLTSRHELALIPGVPLLDTLPAWHIIDPAPESELLADYHEAEAQFGVGWNYLAAINLIESAMGRIKGPSTAGAQGPMQFMPATWDSYGAGGDIYSPHDSIMAAGRFLAANGFADGNVDGALFTYNNSEHYVAAIKEVAAVLADNPLAYRGYYRWEVFYVTTLGEVHLPVGYAADDRVPAADYLATHPQEQ
jgi:glucose/arabinose dehydrogenase